MVIARYLKALYNVKSYKTRRTYKFLRHGLDVVWQQVPNYIIANQERTKLPAIQFPDLTNLSLAVNSYRLGLGCLVGSNLGTVPTDVGRYMR